MRILHIHVKTEYWNEVKNKQKNKEYRLIKPYWTKILKKKYDLIYYYKGYPKIRTLENCISIKYNGYVKTVIKHKEFGEKPVRVYAIDLTEGVGKNGL